jgi:uncharacterized repeat protein (TIGR01451 family)
MILLYVRKVMRLKKVLVPLVSACFVSLVGALTTAAGYHQFASPQSINAPEIAILKSPDFQYVRRDLNAGPGNTATFTVLITNTSGIQLENVQITDPLVPQCDLTVGTLAIDGTATSSCALGGQNLNYTNTVIVSATVNGNEVSSMATAFVQVINPSILTREYPETSYVRSGGTATLTIAITNTGDITLTGVHIAYTPASTITTPPDCRDQLVVVLPSGELAAQQSIWFTCQVTDVVASGFVEHNVRAYPPGLPYPYIAHRSYSIIQVIAPAIAVSKTTSAEPIVAGSAATFTITVTNIGDSVLNNVLADDPLAPACSRAIGTMQPSEVVSYTCELANVMTTTLNTVTASGMPLAGDAVTAQASATVNVPATGISASYTAEPAFVHAGDLLTYTFTVRNVGAANLTDLLMSAEVPAGSTFITGTDNLVGNHVEFQGALNAGEIHTLTFAVQVTRAVGLLSSTAHATAAGEPAFNAIILTPVVGPNAAYLPVFFK